MAFIQDTELITYNPLNYGIKGLSGMMGIFVLMFPESSAYHERRGVAAFLAHATQDSPERRRRKGGRCS